MFLLEAFSFGKTLLGMIAAAAIQRWVFKLIIALALTREFKSDTSNIAFWTGKWYSMGWHTVSQPAREFLCKITELGFFAADFIIGHVLLFIMLPIIAIPQVDKAHSIMLFWLKPSRQIRPPIYSMKQSKLRKRRVWRFAVLYFLLFVLFVALIAGPIVAGKYTDSFVDNLTSNNPKGLVASLFQPRNQSNNDTGHTVSTEPSSTSLTQSTAAARVRLF